MAVALGYGGLANTNGARDFSGKVAAAAVGGKSRLHMRMGYMQHHIRGFRSIIFLLFGGL